MLCSPTPLALVTRHVKVVWWRSSLTGLSTRSSVLPMVVMLTVIELPSNHSIMVASESLTQERVAVLPTVNGGLSPRIWTPAHTNNRSAYNEILTIQYNLSSVGGPSAVADCTCEVTHQISNSSSTQEILIGSSDCVGDSLCSSVVVRHSHFIPGPHHLTSWPTTRHTGQSEVMSTKLDPPDNGGSPCKESMNEDTSLHTLTTNHHLVQEGRGQYTHYSLFRY